MGSNIISERTFAKARKYLALIEDPSASEGEVITANQKLQKLLKENGLQIDDIDVEDGGETVTESTVMVGGRTDAWLLNLAACIARNYRCETVRYHGGRRISIVFIGLESDVVLAKSVFRATRQAAESLWKKESADVREEAALHVDDPKSQLGRHWIKSCVMAARKPFLIGFVSGLSEAYRQNLEEDSQLALAVVVPVAVEEYVAGKNYGRHKYSSACRHGSSYESGRTAGYGVGRGNRVCA